MLRVAALFVILALPAQAQDLGPSLSGDARMGLVWAQEPDWAGQRENGLRMTSRARLKFQFTGETDGGMRFGAEIDLDKARDTRRPPRRVVIDTGS